MQQPLTLSIIIPAYNEEHHLKNCLETISAQTEKPDEVIVVDNNSTDATADVARSFPFVTYINEPKHGIVYGRNAGFDRSKSDVIGRIDADTRLPGDWVAKIKFFYSDPANWQSPWTSSAYFYNVRGRRFFGWAHHMLIFRFNRILTGSYVLWGSNMALPRPLWDSIKPKLCERLDIHEDIDLAVHLNRAGFRVIYQTTNKVGVELRRVRSDRHKLWANLQWWPRTLRVHGYKLWPFAWLIGAAMVYVLSGVPALLERLARLLGRPPIS
jgi:glycosyltransferase involved in cell wall biosynthesis